MKDHEKRELVSELVGIASIAHGTEQLRDRIAYALSGVFSAIDGVTGRAENAESELAQKLEKAEAELVKWRTACHAGKKQVEELQATLAKLREQKPVAWFMFDKKGVMVVTTNPRTASYRWARYSVYKLFSAPVPEQREGNLAVAAKQSLCDSLAVPDDRVSQDDAALMQAASALALYRAGESAEYMAKVIEALLQPRVVKESLTTQADCRTCANRGRVNGLSQETYCESCVHGGRNWRKNHFIDAAADRLLEGGE